MYAKVEAHPEPILVDGVTAQGFLALLYHGWQTPQECESSVTVQRLVKLVWASKIGYLIQELPDAFERAFAQGRTVAH